MINAMERTARGVLAALLLAATSQLAAAAGTRDGGNARFGAVTLGKDRALHFHFPAEMNGIDRSLACFDVYSHKGVRYEGQSLKTLADWLKRRPKPTPAVLAPRAKVAAPAVRTRINDRTLIFVPRKVPRAVAALKPRRKKTAATPLSATETQVLQMVNAERARYGMPPLVCSNGLCRAARDHSQDMATYGFFSHSSPIAGKWSFTQRAARFGANAGAENIATGAWSAAAVMQMWLNSPGHRANMLNSGYRTIGIGCSGGYWTQMFGN